MQSPDLKTNPWIDEQIMAKEEVVVGEGVDMQTRTQVLKYYQGWLKHQEDVYCFKFELNISA